MEKKICVYSASSCAVDDVFFETARELGREMARRGFKLIYGGGLVGLMGAVAKGVHEFGGTVIGVIPEALNLKGIVYDLADQLIVTKGMRERKAVMDELSDAFIALPGGFGTLEEILEIITLKQLRYHNKPIVIMNIEGYYDPLLAQFDRSIEKHFAKAECEKLYRIAYSVDEALSYIDSYEPVEIGTKWLTEVKEIKS